MIKGNCSYRKIIVLSLVLFTNNSCGREENSHEKHADHTAHQKHYKNKSYLPEGAVLSDQKTVILLSDTKKGSIKLDGLILPDERRNIKVAIRFGGRIEKIYVKYPYQYVNKGERLMDIYSAELNTYAKEFIYLLDKKDESLVNLSKQKLLLLGLTVSQIGQIEKTRTAPFSFTYYAPSSGYLLPTVETKGMISMNSKGSAAMKMDNMSGSKSNMDKNPLSTIKDKGSASWIREGMYVSKDLTLFLMNDLDSVWGIVLGNASLQEILMKDSPVTVISEQTKTRIPAKVDFIEPVYEKGQKFTRIRLYIDNSKNRLQLNSLFHVELDWKSENAMILPETAVLDLGRRKMVWIKTGETSSGIGIFEKREVITEKMADGNLLIVKGLKNGDEVIIKAGMLLDSETLVK